MTQALYRYRPASLWALVRLVIADDHDRCIQRDIRDALFLAHGIRRKADEDRQAAEARESAYALLDMF